VAALYLEELYDRAREEQVNIIKYEENLAIQSKENQVLLTAKDVILNEYIEVRCDFVGVSMYGIAPCVDMQLAEMVGISIDSLSQMQDNNVHVFPGLTNRPGIFVVGACRGQYYMPQIITDAKATALAVHALLSQKSIEVELSNAIVDEDKCALCLTCIRSCPHKAMVVNVEKKAAESVPEACQRCGICVGECPAKAITLPLYTDEEVFKQVV
jgi:heterodisulfide reductase subunit A-like polyferredoxin